LTGEPGTGKTQLAAALAHQIGYAPPGRFQAKSTSQARDLFYSYDAVAHFRAPPGSDRLTFVRFEALGLALLRASPWEKVAHLFRGEDKPHEPKASIVLIDEIDKAPRDFPNDILAEIEELRFYAPEVGIDISAPREFRPIIVITSNSERDLPDAFLRRCVYYDIPFPKSETLKNILERRIKSASGGAEPADFIQSALRVFETLRALPGIRKKPATAELIAWVSALRRAEPQTPNPLSGVDAQLKRLGVLVKNREDLELARRALDQRAVGNGS
jgi:MoxR-like ATPase